MGVSGQAGDEIIMNLKWSYISSAAVLWVGMILLCGFLGCAASTDNAPSANVPAISANEALDAGQFEELMKTPGVVVVDVRRPEEFSQGHIPGAINIDVGNESFTQEIGKLDRDKTVLIYCRSGNRTQSAAKIMGDLNFKSFGALKGGITEWKNQGKAVK